MLQGPVTLTRLRLMSLEARLRRRFIQQKHPCFGKSPPLEPTGPSSFNFQ